jgi:hypothetical protein
VALKSPLFAAQAAHSFFALENANWVIVGLDSAYFADELALYINGSIGLADGVQANFLRAQASKGKKVVVLTHHNGLKEDGSGPEPIWAEVMACFPAGTAPAYWCWGHVHVGAAYMTQPNGVQCRCTGYSALPCGDPSELHDNPHVVWFECRNAGDPTDRLRILNGMTLLQFAGAGLTETFYDENQRVARTPPLAAVAAL